MIEGIFSLLAALVEGIVALIGALIEAVAGLFAAGGEALTAGEVLGALVSLVAEIIFWGIFWLIELVVSLFTWRRPRKVSRPVFWRAKNKRKGDSPNDGNA